MSLYVEARSSENGLPINNCTFPWNYYANYGNGLYFVVCDLGSTIVISAPGRSSAWIGTDSYYEYFIWLAPAPPPHSEHSDHSQGYT